MSINDATRQIETLETETAFSIVKQYCGHIDLVIKANGEWWHEGQKIQRSALIQLFSKQLHFEDGAYFLQTPVEKIQIRVEDVAFFAQSVTQITLHGVNYLQVTLTDEQQILIDEKHHLIMRLYANQWRPYVYVRDGMYALIQRSVFYHLIDYGELLENLQGETILRLQSGDYCVDLQQYS